MGVGMKSLKWEGIGTKNLFPHTSTPWEPVADPLWSADPSLKTADLMSRLENAGLENGGSDMSLYRKLQDQNLKDQIAQIENKGPSK